MSTRTGLFRFLSVLFYAALFSSVEVHAQVRADLILTNGKIITVDGEGRIAEAVAVSGNKIIAVGSVQEIARLAGPDTEEIDLQGRSLLPGFIDAHSHVEGLGLSENARVPIQIPHAVSSTDEALERLKARAAEVPADTWIVGQGTYNQPMPSRSELDEALPNHPVVLRWSGHDLLINHRAVEVAALQDVLNPTGIGRIERDDKGEPVILRDTDIHLPIPDPTLDERKAWTLSALRKFYLERGVTTVYDMSTPAIYDYYQVLRDRGELPIRLRMNHYGRDLDALIADMPATDPDDEWLQFGGFKFFMDGVWGTTAATYKPAWQGSGTTWIANNTGGIRVDQETFDDEVRRAHDAGLQIWTHANGDRGADIVLSALERAQAANPRLDARHRIEHFANFLVQDPERTAERFERLKTIGVIPVPQTAFLWRLTDTGVQEPDVRFAALRTLVREGFMPPGGSDTLGTQNFATNPLFSISAAVNRRTKHGTLVQADEALRVMDAIRSHTIWAAYSGFEEDKKGSIEVGKLADLVVLSDDPLTVSPSDLLEILPVIVIVDGKIAHTARDGF